MKKLIQSFRHAINGFARIVTTERNLQIHLLALCLVVALALYFSITRMEWLVILLISSLVISLEILNSSVEKLSDFVEPNKHEKIKIIKDTAAAAVLVAAAFAVIIAIIIFKPYFLTQL